jgi:hypothetical protein
MYYDEDYHMYSLISLLYMHILGRDMVQLMLYLDSDDYDKTNE